MKTISKDTPIAEITLRKYEKPDNLSERELIRKLCLSIGLLQPGDSRDIIVDILYVLIREGKELSFSEIEKFVKEEREKANLSLKGTSQPNIRRQLRRLKEMFIIEAKGNKYKLAEGLSLYEIFSEKIKKFYIEPILERVEEYFKRVDVKKEERDNKNFEEFKKN